MLQCSKRGAAETLTVAQPNAVTMTALLWNDAVRTSNMYLRFVLPGKHPDTGFADGVFEAAYTLRREGELLDHEWIELDELLCWFGEHLSIPTRFHRSKSKGRRDRITKGVSWFKSTATQHLARMHRMAAILEDHGHHVTMIKTARPGYIVYEDANQVVAEPFDDLRG